MPDGWEDQQQLVALVGVECLLGAHPAGVDALLAVTPWIRVVGSARYEEPGVETDLDLRRGDPTRPRDESAPVVDHEPGFLLKLPHTGACRTGVVIVHSAAGE